MNSSVRAATLPASPVHEPPAASKPAAAASSEGTRFRVLGALSFSHFLNDMMQSLILALYPMLKADFSLSFAQIGVITRMFQFTASLLQPLVGIYTDRRPQPYALTVGMGFTLVGLLVLAVAPSYGFVLLAAMLVGTGSSVFHPESSRMARLASGGRHGLAQSIFQVGGNAGQAMGPLAAAWIIIPFGRHSVAGFSAVALIAMGVLWTVGNWYVAQRAAATATGAVKAAARAVIGPAISRRRVVISVAILMVLVLSKNFYVTSLSSYYTFYLMDKFGLSVSSAQTCLFVLLFSVAAGTLLGGLVADRVGRKNVIWFSILGAAPFTLALPHANLEWTIALTVIIGLVIASAFSAIVVFAQDLMPGRVGLVAGLFFGLSFGVGGLGAALLGKVADVTSINTVYNICAFIPLMGLLAAALPNIEHQKK